MLFSVCVCVCVSVKMFARACLLTLTVINCVYVCVRIQYVWIKEA